MTKPIVLTAIVCLMFITSGYALKKIPSARNLPQRADFKSFPMQIGEWRGKRSYIDKKILAELWADDYVQATYFKPNSGNAIQFLTNFTAAACSVSLLSIYAYHALVSVKIGPAVYVCVRLWLI